MLVIDLEKDVDGFYFLNMGCFWFGYLVMIFFMFVGIIEMFYEYGIELEGKNVVVIGCFNIVGKFMV